MQRIIYRLFLEFFVSLNRLTDRWVRRRCNDEPYGNRPLASIENYLQLANEAHSMVYPEIDHLEHEMGYAISPDWLKNLALYTQISIKRSPVCYAHGRVLYSRLSRYLADQGNSSSIKILETGSARGFSTLCMAKALDDYGASGTIMTFDLLPHHRSIFWNSINDLDGRQSRAQLLAPWVDLLEKYIIFYQGDTRIELPKVNAGRIHFAYLDGAHTYADILFEFNQIKDCQRVGDIIVFDDYTPNQYPGVVEAVDQICSSHHYIPNVLKAHENRGYVIATKSGDG